MNSTEGDPSRITGQSGSELSPPNDAQPRRHSGVIALEAVQRWMEPARKPDGTDYTRATIALTLGMDPDSTDPFDTVAIDTTLENLREAVQIIPSIPKDGSIDPRAFTRNQRLGYTTALNLAVSVELQAAQEDRTFDALAAAADAYKTADLTEDEIIKLQQQLADTQEKIHIDNLTGLSNEAGQKHWLEKVLNHKAGLAVYGIDGDGVNLKRFNNLFGMAVGDAILRHIANELTTISERRTDILVDYARLHGDEFSVLFAGASAKDVKGMVRKFHKRQHAKDNSAFFERIGELREEGLALNAEVKAEIVDGKEIEFLFVNDEKMGPISDLAVLGIGSSGKPITSMQTLHENRKAAEKNMEKRKKNLYKKNGGKYRTA